METHDRRHQEASGGSHQDSAAADAGAGDTIVLVEECGSRSRPGVDMAVRDTMLSRGDGVAVGRAAAAAPEPRPRRHSRPATAAQRAHGPGEHAGGASVGPAGLDGNGPPREHGDVTGLLRRPVTPDSQGTCTPPGLNTLAH